MPVKYERSCGAVVFTREKGDLRYVIVSNMSGRHHCFPKGHVEQGETERETAVREIMEETSLTVDFIEGFREEETYPLRGGEVSKTVVYFLAEYKGQTPKARENEIGALTVAPLAEALSLLEFESSRSILRKADAFIKKRLNKGENDMNENKNSAVSIVLFTEDRIRDVVDFEKRLREEEDVWGWEIDDDYMRNVQNCFHDGRFSDCLSLLAYENGKVVGRIDSALLPTRMDGSVKGYLDWICVLKSCRHKGVGQALLEELRRRLKEKGADALIALTASNEEAQRFYRAIPGSEMHDLGIWIDL